MTKHFPKVIIITESFNVNDGGGITLSNLFYDWPQNKIAISATKIIPHKNTKCIKYYQFGYLEHKRLFPFSLFQKKSYSGQISKEHLVKHNKSIEQNLILIIIHI